eukprot:snap_masked-scaffold_8-processed-gene-11.30-mRNA-1 protein AED:1.00 eAED:1.00 QI:0/0/0/0/1/1/2/0/266
MQKPMRTTKFKRKQRKHKHWAIQRKEFTHLEEKSKWTILATQMENKNRAKWFDIRHYEIEDAETFVSSLPTALCLEKTDKEVLEKMQLRLELLRKKEEIKTSVDKVSLNIAGTMGGIYKKLQGKERKVKILRSGFVVVLFLIIVVSGVLFYFQHYDVSKSYVDGNFTEESEPLDCSDEDRLCDFETKNLCNNCECLQSIRYFSNFSFGDDVFERIYLLEINLVPSFLLSSREIRKDIEFGGLCSICNTDMKMACPDKKATCCLDLQ